MIVFLLSPALKKSLLNVTCVLVWGFYVLGSLEGSLLWRMLHISILSLPLVMEQVGNEPAMDSVRETAMREGRAARTAD